MKKFWQANNYEIHDFCSRYSDVKEMDESKEQCQFCGNRYTYLERHIRFIHENKITCDVCDKHFYSKIDKKIHITNVHEMRKTHQCNKYQLAFSQNRSLKRHIQQMHDRNDVHECNLCQAVYYSEKTLKVHHRWRHEKHQNICQTLLILYT